MGLARLQVKWGTSFGTRVVSNRTIRLSAVDDPPGLSAAFVYFRTQAEDGHPWPFC